MSWADAVDDDEDTQQIESVAAVPKDPPLPTLTNISLLNFMFDRRMEHVVLVDLDGLKKGVGKNTYQFITGSLSPVTAVLLFRRAPHHADHENADASKAQKRRNRLDHSAASKIRVVCSACRNTLHVKPYLGSTRFLIEAPHDQPTGTRYLIGLYLSHIVARFKQLSRFSTTIHVISSEQGAAEAIDLAKKISPEQSLQHVTVEDLQSFPSGLFPTVVTVPTRERFEDQLPGESGLDTARKRTLKLLSGSHLPTTKGALESALQPLCRLRGDVDSWAVVDMMKANKVWAWCTDACGTFYYPKEKDPNAAAKPNKTPAKLSAHASRTDPHLESGAKVVTAALAIVPPEDQWAQIQRVREKHDKAYDRWPPHINLMFPFIPESKFDEIAPQMEAALRDFGPIHVTLASFSHFSHGKTSKTLFCDPDSESKAALQKLYARLEAEFPFCVNPGHDGFTPHLTLGQFNSDNAISEMIATLSKDWQPIQFLLTHVSCLARERDTRFETKKTYSLKGTPGQLPSAVKDENSPQEQVYRRVVSELKGLNPSHRPKSPAELNTFVRKFVPNTEVPLADLMALLHERDVVTLKRDLAIEERLTPVIYNKAVFKRLERPASEKDVSDPAPAGGAAPAPPGAAQAAKGPAFIKAAVYSGQKEGYAFKMGDQGLGYYKEGK